ncbi:MAG: hypothetical protein WBG46_10515 [Nonlabens sp.]
MSLNKHITRAFVVIMVFLLMGIIDGDLHAQIDLPDDGTVDDTATASINTFIGLGLLVGAFLGIKKLRADHQNQV